MHWLLPHTIINLHKKGSIYIFKAVTDTVDIPVVIYNVPSRTGVSISPETVAKLAEIKNIVGIKEASGDIDQTSEILSKCDINVLSGDDSLTTAHNVSWR